MAHPYSHADDDTNREDAGQFCWPGGHRTGLALCKCGGLLGWHEVLKDFIARKLADKIVLELCLN